MSFQLQQITEKKEEIEFDLFSVEIDKKNKCLIVNPRDKEQFTVRINGNFNIDINGNYTISINGETGIVSKTFLGIDAEKVYINSGVSLQLRKFFTDIKNTIKQIFGQI